jgi:uncharacterized membrane protein
LTILDTTRKDNSSSSRHGSQPPQAAAGNAIILETIEPTVSGVDGRSQSENNQDESGNNGQAGQTSRLLRAVVDPEIPESMDFRPERVKMPYSKSLIACLALVLLVFVIVIQIIALVAAVRGKRLPSFEVTWCSPMFAPLALSVLDGNCQFHDVVSRQVWGNGCIQLPAHEQEDWLTGTIVLVSLSLVFQLFDFCVLTLVHQHERWQEVKMKRPWLTMFGGMLILIIVAAYGTFYASRIPIGVTDMVWVFRWDGTGDFTSVCSVELNSAGLRGAFISWLDGLFDSWGGTYYGL